MGYRNRVLNLGIDTQIRYLIFLLLNLWFEAFKFIIKLHWPISIDFDLKIIIFHAEIARTIFK